MPNLARPGSSRTLRILQRALVETACRGEACALEVPQAFRRPVPILSLWSVNGEVMRIFLVGRDGCSSAFIQLAIYSYPVLPDPSP